MNRILGGESKREVVSRVGSGTDMAHHGDVVRRDIGLLVLRLRRVVPRTRRGELLIHSINKTVTAFSDYRWKA